MTQEEVARRAGIDRTFIGLFESSKSQPTLSVISSLQKALSQTPGSLVAKAVALSDETGARNS
jgi:transcriptional regulator with XRE-family HTH domain